MGKTVKKIARIALPLVGSAVGGPAGGALVTALFGKAKQPKTPQLPSPSVGPAPLPNPVRPTALATPESLAQMDELQQRSYIATQGVSGTLPGQDIQDYYKNLLGRTLITEQGGFQDFNSLLPVERQYIQQILGYSGSDPKEFLQRIQYG